MRLASKGHPFVRRAPASLTLMPQSSEAVSRMEKACHSLSLNHIDAKNWFVAGLVFCHIPCGNQPADADKEPRGSCGKAKGVAKAEMRHWGR
jgi:hypothetical protein